MSLQDVSNIINVVPNFPKEGIFFRDMATLMADPDLYELAIDMMVDMVKDVKIDYVAGLESRGFILGRSLASRLHKGFVMLRKPNKMPNVVQISYGLEYGEDILTVQKNLIPQESHVLIVDDLEASGGSLLAGCKLIELIGCKVSGCCCLMELVGIPQRRELEKYKIFNLIKYPAHSEDKFISRTDKMLFRKPVEYVPMNSISHKDDRIVVFSHPSMKEIANSIVNSSKSFRDGAIKWSHSSDNYPLITFENIKYLTNKRIVFLGSLYNRANFSEQLSLLTMLPKYTIKSLDIFIPYFAPGLTKHNSLSYSTTLSTAESYAKIISNCLIPTQDGLPRIHIYDIHSQETKSWFSDTAIVNLDTAVFLIKNKINLSTTIVFPDTITQNKFMQYFEEFRIINIETNKKINWPSPGYDEECLDDTLIIDDWVQCGDIFEKCRLALLEMGAKKISAYATHAVFPNGSYKNAMFNNFHKIYVTNSIPEVTTKIEDRQPFEVLKLDTLIRDNLLQLFDIDPMTDAVVPRQFTVYVASENNTKLAATHDAVSHVLHSLGVEDCKLNVYGIDVPSGVSEQPVNEETLVGCQNRLNRLVEYVDKKGIDCDFFVSIESGMYYEGELNNDTQVRDHCQVIVVARSEKHVAECTKLSEQFTTFPANFMIESINQHKEVTVGKLIERAYGYKAGTWHEHFGEKITRYEMIFNTIVSAFGETCGNFVE